MICRRLVFKDLMQHINTRARCSLPAGGAVHPTQDFPVYNIYSNNFSDATCVELSEYSNIVAAVNETVLSRGISVNIKATSI